MTSSWLIGPHWWWRWFVACLATGHYSWAGDGSMSVGRTGKASMTSWTYSCICLCVYVHIRIQVYLVVYIYMYIYMCVCGIYYLDSYICFWYWIEMGVVKVRLSCLGYQLVDGHYLSVWLILFPPSSAYMRQWIGLALVQIMACRLFGSKPLSLPNAGWLSIGPLGTSYF